MWIFNLIFCKIFDFIFYAFRSLSPWFGMFVISFLTALLLLLIYRYTSNQEGIKKIKNKIKAHLLELRLFKDSLSTTFQAQGKLYVCLFKYMGYNLKPFLVMIIPFILILIQINFWFSYDSLSVGEITLLKMKLTEGNNLLDADISVRPSSGVIIETSPLRIEEEQEIDWRIRAEEKGTHDLIFNVNGQKVIKKAVVKAKALAKISPIKVQSNFLEELLYPMESPIGKEMSVKSIEIIYPNKDMNLFGWKVHSFFGWNFHWIIAWFILSVILGFALKGIFKVEL